MDAGTHSSRTITASFGERWNATAASEVRTDRRRLPRDVRRPCAGHPLRGWRSGTASANWASTSGLACTSGEIEVQPDDIAGLAVHIGARICRPG